MNSMKVMKINIGGSNRIMKKAIFMVMGILMLNFMTVQTVFAGQDILVASTSNTGKTDVTANPPHVYIEEEAQLPSAKDNDEERGWFSKYKWWLLAGLVSVGGAVAADGGSSDGGTTPTTGNIQVEW